MNLFQFAACGQTRADYRLGSLQSNRVPPENAAGAHPFRTTADRPAAGVMPGAAGKRPPARSRLLASWGGAAGELAASTRRHSVGSC
jgi:hypothetical protein